MGVWWVDQTETAVVAWFLKLGHPGRNIGRFIVGLVLPIGSVGLIVWKIKGWK